MDLALGMGGHKSSLALSSHHQVVSGKFVNGFTNCPLADSEAPGQIHFTGDSLAGFPFAHTQAVEDQPLDLLVQRAECRRRRIRDIIGAPISDRTFVRGQGG